MYRQNWLFFIYLYFHLYVTHNNLKDWDRQTFANSVDPDQMP